MKPNIGVSTHTKTVRQNGIKYRYVYVLKKVVLSDELTPEDIKSYPVVKQGANGVYLFEFDHKETTIDDQKVYDNRRAAILLARKVYFTCCKCAISYQ